MMLSYHKIMGGGKKKKGQLYIPEGSREGLLEEAALDQRMQRN